MKDLQQNQAIMSRLEDTNWSKRMADRVLQSQIANQENSLSGKESIRSKLGWKGKSMKMAIAAIVFLGLGIGFFQMEKRNNAGEPGSSSLASIDTAMMGDIYWEKDEWEDELVILKVYE